MKLTAQTEMDQRIAEQAAEWLSALPHASHDELTAFADWVAESPRHLREFLFMSALDSELGELDPQRRLSVDQALAVSNVIPLVPSTSVPAEPKRQSTEPAPVRLARSRWITWRLTAGVAAVSLVAGTLWWIASPSQPTYSTAIGEQRTVALADGSVLQINSRSQVQVEVSDRARDIRVLEGEALFKVAPDPVRPFRVHASGVTVQAIGTQFNVNRRPSGITVSVIEGRVRVSGEPQVTLGAGQEIRLSHAGHIQRRSAIDPLSMPAWRQHRLIFRDDTLEDIVAEINRYNARSQISLEGDTIRARRYTAVFDADDPGSLVTFLRQDVGITVHAGEDGGIVVAQR